MNEPETKFVPYVSATEVGSSTATAVEETYDVSAIVPENAIAVVVQARYNFATNSLTCGLHGKAGVTDAEETQLVTAHANAAILLDLQHVTHIVPLDPDKKFYSKKSAAGAIDDLIMTWVGWVEAIQPKVK